MLKGALRVKKLELFFLPLNFVVKVTKSVHAKGDSLNFDMKKRGEIYIWT